MSHWHLESFYKSSWISAYTLTHTFTDTLPCQHTRVRVARHVLSVVHSSFHSMLFLCNNSNNNNLFAAEQSLLDKITFISFGNCVRKVVGEGELWVISNDIQNKALLERAHCLDSPLLYYHGFVFQEVFILHFQKQRMQRPCSRERQRRRQRRWE